MSRLSTFAAVMAFAFLASSVSVAQENRGGPPIPGAGTSALKPTLEDLHQQIQELRTQQSELLAELRKANSIDLAKRVERMERAVGNLTTLVDQAYDRLEQISTADPQGSGYTPRILANMATNPRFRDEMERVSQAKLRFRNQAAFEPILYVNGVAWRVRTGHSFLPVPRDAVAVGDAFGESFNVQFEPGVADQTITITADGTVERPVAVASAR